MQLAGVIIRYFLVFLWVGGAVYLICRGFNIPHHQLWSVLAGTVAVVLALWVRPPIGIS